MGNESFTLTLPSNVPDLHNKNTCASFVTQLAEKLRLDGRWEVGLKEISYCYSWWNIPSSCPLKVYKRIGNNIEPLTDVTAELPPGYYSSIATLGEEIERVVKNALPTIAWKTEPSVEVDRIEQRIIFREGTIDTSSTNDRMIGDDSQVESDSHLIETPNDMPAAVQGTEPQVSAGTSTDASKAVKETTTSPSKQAAKSKPVTKRPPPPPSYIQFIFDDEFMSMLGFDKTNRTYTRKGNRYGLKADQSYDLRNGLHNIFVETNIVKAVRFGHLKAQVIKVVQVPPLNTAFGEQIYVQYPSPEYIPLQNNEIDRIIVNLRTKAGDLVPFQYGTTICTFQFQRVD